MIRPRVTVERASVEPHHFVHGVEHSPSGRAGMELDESARPPLVTCLTGGADAGGDAVVVVVPESNQDISEAEVVVRAGQSPSGRPARSTLPAAAPRFSLERRAVPVSCRTRECRTFPRLLPHCAAAHVLP